MENPGSNLTIVVPYPFDCMVALRYDEYFNDLGILWLTGHIWPFSCPCPTHSIEVLGGRGEGGIGRAGWHQWKGRMGRGQGISREEVSASVGSWSMAGDGSSGSPSWAQFLKQLL